MNERTTRRLPLYIEVSGAHCGDRCPFLINDETIGRCILFQDDSLRRDWVESLEPTFKRNERCVCLFQGRSMEQF